MIRVFCVVLCLFLLFFNPAAVFGNPGSSSSSPSSDEFNPFEENGKVGLKNQKGDILIPAQYDALGWSDGHFSIIENVTGYRLKDQWGLINLTNHKVTKPEFIELSASETSIIVARKKFPNSIRVLTGGINPAGKTIIPFAYDGIKISGLRAIVFEKSGFTYKHGLIDFQNNVLIPLKYERIYPLGSLRFAVVSFENKIAIYSEKGEQLSGFVIDSLSDFRKNYAVIYQNSLQGVINRDGQIVLEPTTQTIRIDADGSVFTRKANTWKFLDGENRPIREIVADSIESYSLVVYKIKNAAGYRLVDSELKPINENFFTDITTFRKGKAVFSVRGVKGIIREDGKVIIEPRYSCIFPDHDLIRAAERSGNLEKWSLLDSTGKSLTKKNYDLLNEFNGSFFPARHRKYWGAIDRSGKEIIACVHDSLVQYRDDHVVVKFKGQYGIITTNEKWVVTPQPNKIRLAGKERFIEYTTDNKFLKDLKGNTIYFTPNRIELVDNMLAEYLPDGEINQINFNGQVVARVRLSPDAEYVSTSAEGYRAIRKDGKFGFVDDRGRLRIANRYDDVTNFSEGLAGAKLLGKWGYIGKDDKIAIQPAYDEVFPFSNGMAMVRQKSYYGVIDKNGKIVLPVKFDAIEKLPGNKFMVRQHQLFGLADKNGKMVLNAKFERIEDLNNNYFIVSREGKSGVISMNGMSTIPMIYDCIVFDRFHNQFMAVQSSQWEKKTF